MRVGAIEARAREYAARMPDDQFFSHTTAAILHGLPIPAYLFVDRSTLDVATTVREHRRAGRGVVGHFVLAGQVTVMDVRGLQAASAVDAWCQLSSVLSVEELVIMGDSLVRRQQPFATREQLESAVAQYVGHPGVRRLRAALEWIRPRTDSPRETTLRLIIVQAGLPEPEVNVEMFNRFGEFMALGDLVYVRYKILIEYDGGEHRENEKQFHRDIDRLDEPMEEGWRVIRVNNSHLGHRQHTLIARIRRALLERGWVPPA
jgi:very-short-patch-repair endonuclease